MIVYSQFAASNGFSWPTFKENIRPYISYIAFTVGLLTVGLDTASKNFVLQEDVRVAWLLTTGQS